MKFIRDIIFEKRAARTTEPARWVEEFAEESGGAVPDADNAIDDPVEAGPELEAAATEVAGIALPLDEAEPEDDAGHAEIDMNVFSEPLVLRKPAAPAEKAEDVTVSAEEEPGDEGGHDDFESAIAALDVLSEPEDDDLTEEEAEPPFVNPQQSFYERLKRLEAQRDERPAPSGFVRPGARPAAAAEARVLATPQPAVPTAATPRPAASADVQARPAADRLRARTLEEMPFVTAPQARVAPGSSAAQPELSRRDPAELPRARPETVDMPSAAVERPFVQPVDLTQIQVPPPAAGRGSNRSERVKTRLLGFNPEDIGLSDPFEKPAAKTSPTFPVGWLVVTAGPGRGASFALHDGVSRIGRGEDQAVSLNFGDNSISRENHVAVAYDAEQSAFFIGQSGRANIVRLNNKPLLSTEQLQSGDQIRVGETTLRFVALCGESFTWVQAAGNDARHA